MSLPDPWNSCGRTSCYKRLQKSSPFKMCSPSVLYLLTCRCNTILPFISPWSYELGQAPPERTRHCNPPCKITVAKYIGMNSNWENQPQSVPTASQDRKGQEQNDGTSARTLWFHQLFSASLQFHPSAWRAASGGLPCDSPSAAPAPSAESKNQSWARHRHQVTHGSATSACCWVCFPRIQPTERGRFRNRIYSSRHLIQTVFSRSCAHFLANATRCGSHGLSAGNDTVFTTPLLFHLLIH